MHPEDFAQTMRKHMAMDIPVSGRTQCGSSSRSILILTCLLHSLHLGLNDQLQNDKYNLGGDMDKWKLLVREPFVLLSHEGRGRLPPRP